MQRLNYSIYDVFTSQGLAGNPLAVVYGADDLGDDLMQAIAREFNLSETVFILSPARDIHNAALRIFMPSGELPFAGHPTVGAAVAMAEGRGIINDTPVLLAMEEKIGLVRAAVRKDSKGVFAEFDLPRLPSAFDVSLDRETAAAALGLNPQDIGFENHEVSAWTAGVPYIFVPVHDLAVAARARLDDTLWLSAFDIDNPLEVPCAYVYCRDCINHDSDFHVRMFAGPHGIVEDPATGSAAAAFAGAIAHFDDLTNGMHRLVIEQGIEIGRPSFIHLEIEMKSELLKAARIGGYAVKVAEGTLIV